MAADTFGTEGWRKASTREGLSFFLPSFDDMFTRVAHGGATSQGLRDVGKAGIHCLPTSSLSSLYTVFQQFLKSLCSSLNFLSVEVC